MSEQSKTPDEIEDARDVLATARKILGILAPLSAADRAKVYAVLDALRE